MTIVVTYAYDARGNRVEKTIDGTLTTRYLVDENTDYAQVLEERDSTGSLRARYVYGHDLLSQTRDSVVSYYHPDGLGSPRTLTDSAQTVTNTYTYDAFGNLLDKTGVTVNEYLYTGEFFDANIGFYYLRARYMNPALGRFVTQDTFEGFHNDPYSLHKYLYAHANPVNRLDPSGRMTVNEFTVTAGIIGAMSGIHIYQIFTPPEDRTIAGYANSASAGALVGGLLAYGSWYLWFVPPAIQAVSGAKEVAVDTCSLVNALEFGQLNLLDKLLAGRRPVVSMQAAKEYLVKGDAARLRQFLVDRGGRIAAAAPKSLVTMLIEFAEKVPVLGTGNRVLHLKDARVVASAVKEGIPLITADGRLYKLLKAAAEADIYRYPIGEWFFQ